MNDGTQLLSDYRDVLSDIFITHAWRGHGSAIFLELGKLTPKLRSDGSSGNPDGEFTLMIGWSWRIEEADHIVCGSESEVEVFEHWLRKLVGRKVLNVTTFGRIPEIMLSLSDDLYVSSFMTAEGGPEWALMDHRTNGLPTLMTKKGRLWPEERRSSCS